SIENPFSTGLALADNPSLTTVELTQLQSVGGNFEIIRNPPLTDLSFPRLETIGLELRLYQNPALRTVSLPALEHCGDIYAHNCALDQPSVNALLRRLVEIGWAAPGRILRLNGGTNAAPTGQGVVDKTTLIAAGASVTTN